jgi:hypothetical protein
MPYFGQYCPLPTETESLPLENEERKRGKDKINRQKKA